jgi:hypothetical protein
MMRLKRSHLQNTNATLVRNTLSYQSRQALNKIIRNALYWTTIRKITIKVPTIKNSQKIDNILPIVVTIVSETSVLCPKPVFFTMFLCSGNVFFTMFVLMLTSLRKVKSCFFILLYMPFWQLTCQILRILRTRRKPKLHVHEIQQNNKQRLIL